MPEISNRMSASALFLPLVHLCAWPLCLTRSASSPRFFFASLFATHGRSEEVCTLGQVPVPRLLPFLRPPGPLAQHFGGKSLATISCAIKTLVKWKAFRIRGPHGGPGSVKSRCPWPTMRLRMLHIGTEYTQSLLFAALTNHLVHSLVLSPFRPFCVLSFTSIRQGW